MVFFKYHIITFVFLIKLLFIKTNNEALKFYQDKVINLNKNYNFNILSNKIKNNTNIIIIIDFNCSVSIPKGNIKFIYSYLESGKEKIEKLNFSYSNNNKVAYLNNSIKAMKNNYYIIEFTSSKIDKFVRFFLYDNQNEYSIPENNKTFSKDFNLININQDIIMNFKWNVDTLKYLRTNWTSDSDSDNFILKVNNSSITGKNNYNIIEYNNEKKPINFTIPKNCGEKILKLNFDINSNNIYDLKEIINKTDYIYFNDLYYFMSVLNYDNNLMNYFKFDKIDSDDFEFKYIISNKSESDLKNDIKSGSFNNFINYPDSILGYQIKESNGKYIILKITNLNKNTYVSETKTLNIYKETEIIPKVNFNEFNLNKSEIYKIVLDISSTNKYLFYIKNYNIEIQMMNNSFKDLKTNLFYINKTTTNSNNYFNITLINNITDNSIQINNDNNIENYYIYNYNENNSNNFEGNFSKNLYFINIYDNDSQNKVLYACDSGENINIYYKFGNDLNLSNFISFKYYNLNYPLIADKKFDLLSLSCSNTNCFYSIIYKKLYENDSYITITYNTLYEFFVLNNQPLKININNPNFIINSFFNAKLLPNLSIDLLKVIISMDNQNNVQLDNDKYENNSTNITEGKYLYINSEKGDSFITLNFSYPYYQINYYDAIEEQFNFQYNLFIIPDLKSNEFINLIIFSNSNNINIFFEEKNEYLFWKEPSNNYNNGTNKTFHITKESKKYIYIKIENINNISDYKYHFKKMTYDNLSDLRFINTTISDFLIYEYNDTHNTSKTGTIEFNFLKGHDILNLYLYENLGDIQQTSNGFKNEKKNSIDSFELDKNIKTYYIVLFLKNKTEENELNFYVFNQEKIYELNISNTYSFYYQLNNDNSKTITFKKKNDFNYITSKIIDISSMNNELIFFNDSLNEDSFALLNNSEHFKYNNYNFMTFKITNNNNDPNINIVNLNITFDFLNIKNIEEEGYNKDLNLSIFIINNNENNEGMSKIVTFFNLTEINYFEIESDDKQFVIKSYKEKFLNENDDDIYFNFDESIKYYLFKINESENFSYSFYELKKSLDNLSNEIIYKFNCEEDYLIYNFDNKLKENILNIFFDENVFENNNLSILIYDSYESIRKSDEKTFIYGDPYNLNYELNKSLNYSIVFMNNNLNKNQNFFINTKDYINLISNDYKYTYNITYFIDKNITFYYFYNNSKKYKYFHYQFGNFVNETKIYCQLTGKKNYISNDFFNTFEIDKLEEFYIYFSINRNKEDKNNLPFIFKIDNDEEPDSNLHLLKQNFNYNNNILTNRTIYFNQSLKSYYNKEKIAFKLFNESGLKINCSYSFNSNDINVYNDFENCSIDMDSSSESYYYFENKISDDKKTDNDNAIIKIDIFNEKMTVDTKKFEIKPYLKTIFYLNSEIKLCLDQNETKIYNISNMTNDKFVILQTKKEEYLKYQLFKNGNKLINLYGETNNYLNLFEFINKSYKYFNYFNYSDEETNLTSTFLEIDNFNSSNISNYLIFLDQDKKYILYMDLIFGTPIMNYCHSFSNISYIIDNIDCNKALDSYFFIDKNSNQTLVQIDSTLNNSLTYLNLIEIIDNNDKYNLDLILGEIYFITIQNNSGVININNSNNYNIKDLKNLKIGLFSANKKNFNYNETSDNYFIIKDLIFINNSFQLKVSCPDNNFLLIVKIGLVKSDLIDFTVIRSNDKGNINKNVTIFELPYDSQNNSCELTLTNKKGEPDCIYLLYQLTDSEIYSLPNKKSKCINLLKNEEIKILIDDPLKKPINSDEKNFNYIRKLKNIKESSFFITLQTNENSNIQYNFYLYDVKTNNPDLKKYIPVLAIVVIIIIVVIFIIIYTIHRNYKKKKILIFKDFFEGNKKKKKDKNLVLKTLTINSIFPTNKNEDIDIDLEKESFDNMDKSIEKSTDNID